MSRRYHVYILTNEARTVLYTGMTSDLSRRIDQHRSGQVPGFTKRYRVHRLVYHESFADVLEAIAREKQIKGGSRKKKEDLVNGLNPEWRDLSVEEL